MILFMLSLLFFSYFSHSGFLKLQPPRRLHKAHILLLFFHSLAWIMRISVLFRHVNLVRLRFSYWNRIESYCVWGVMMLMVCLAHSRLCIYLQFFWIDSTKYIDMQNEWMYTAVAQMSADIFLRECIFKTHTGTCYTTEKKKKIANKRRLRTATTKQHQIYI